MGVLCSASGAEPDTDSARKQLQSDHFTVIWGSPGVFGPDAELEIGDGNGHGGTLRWLRFQPGSEGVAVLSIQFDEGRRPYRSKWPPDRALVAVRRARLASEAYAELLRDLAIVNSAKLIPVERPGGTTTTNDVWVSARLSRSNKAQVELNWAGYEGSYSEVDIAKPRAAVRLARASVQGLNFQDDGLTDGERAWASAKFARDWQRFRRLEFHWWVRERYIQTIGLVGDRSALPVLRDILAADLPPGSPRNASEDRCVYHAINAVTRLTNPDVGTSRSRRWRSR